MYLPPHLRFFRSPDPEPTTGGGGKEKEIEKTEPEKNPVEPKEEKGMTKAEVDALLAKEREKVKKEVEEEQKKKNDLEQGKFKDLYEREQAAKAEEEKKRIAAESETRQLKIRDKLREYIAKNAADYTNSSQWILKALDISEDDSDAKIDEKIKTVVEQFKKDNPIKTASNSGAPEPPANRGRVITHRALKGQEITLPENNKETPVPFATIGWRQK